MEKQRKISFKETRMQVERVQKIYSSIGEPLGVDVIIDLYRHLGTALQGCAPQKKKRQRPRI